MTLAARDARAVLLAARASLLIRVRPSDQQRATISLSSDRNI